MKTKALLSLGVTALVLFLYSCDPTIPTAPTLSVTPTEDVAAVPGDVISYQAIVTSDTDLTSLEMTAKIGQTLISEQDTLFPAMIQSAIVTFSFTVPDSISVPTEIMLTFEARNSESATTTTLSRNIQVTIPYGEINNYTAVILSDIENPSGSSFFSLETNELMQLAAAVASSQKVDLIYYYGATNKATICAPSDTRVEVFTDRNNLPIVNRFATGNNTKLAMVTVTADNFNAAVNDKIIVENIPATTATAVTQLAVGNIFYAETAGGKKGLILVKNITGTQGTSQITIEVKIQK